MSKLNTILLAAAGGAVAGALVASFVTSDQGKQFLNTAKEAIKDKVPMLTKENLGALVKNTAETISGKGGSES